MNKDARSTWRDSKLFKVIAITGFVCAVWGAILVHGLTGTIPERLMRVPWAVIKLYMMGPSLDFTMGPVPYEIARWLAPATTAIGVFATFEKFFIQLRQNSRILRDGHVTVLGYSDDAKVFLTHLLENPDKNKVQAVLPDDVDPVLAQRLRDAGIIVRLIDYSQTDSDKNYEAVERLKLDVARAIVSFEPEPENFGHVRFLNTYVEAKHAIPVHIHAIDNRVKTLIEKEMDGYSAFDIHYFSVNELVSAQLIDTPSFDVFPKVEPLPEGAQAKDYKEIADHFGVPRVLLVGFGQVGQAVLMQISNAATINPVTLPQVVIVDRAATQLFAAFEGRRDGLEQVMDIQVIESELDSRALNRQLEELNRAKPFTSVIYALDDTKESLLSVDYLAKGFREAEVAVYCPNKVDLDALVRAVHRHGLDFTLFGEKTSALEPDMILNEVLNAKAKEFNHRYDIAASELTGGWEPGDPDESWRKLTTIKKESSLFQSAHARTKQWVLEVLCRDYLHTTVPELLASWRARMEGHSVMEQVDILEADPYMNFMTALEHKRWSNFYYMRGFTLGEKDEANRRHDCLIDDWDVFMATMRDKVIYDFISTLTLSDQPSELGS